MRGRRSTHAWSLCVEEHFYLTLPVVIYLLRKKRGCGRRARWLRDCGWRIGAAVGVVEAFGGSGGGGDRGTFLFVYIKDIYYPTYACWMDCWRE